VVHEYLESASPNTVRKKQRELFWEVVASASATPTASACPPSFLPDDRPPKVTGDPALISYSYSSPSFDGDDDDDDVPVVEAVLVDGEGRAWVAAALDADAAEADLIEAGMTALPFLPQVAVGPCSPGTVLVIATPAGEGANNLFEGANDNGVIGGRWQWWQRRDLGLSFAVAIAVAVAMMAVTLALALALALSLAEAGGCAARAAGARLWVPVVRLEEEEEEVAAAMPRIPRGRMSGPPCKHRRPSLPPWWGRRPLEELTTS